MNSTLPFSIRNLESYREGKRLEFKSAKGGLPNSLWETYSAFANSDGGIIVLGVNERKDGSFMIEGLKDAVKIQKDFWNLINNRQKISTNILTDRMVKIENIDGKDILVIRVPRAERTTRPVYVGMDPRLGSYRRNGEGDYHCSIDEVSLMLRDASSMTEDYKLLTNLDFSVFCPDTIRAYRNIFRLIHDDHLWNQEEDEIFMRRIGAVREDKETGKFHPTAAGLLMFGYEYEILEEFPQYFLDYQENRTGGIYARWTDRITSQTGDWSGNVFDFLLKVVPKLQADLKVPFVFNGNHTVKNTPLHKAVREAMVNMLSNADFYGRRGVVVQKNADGFKFANPGNMRVSLTEAVHDNMSDPRNGVMLKMLALVEYGERAGSGLQGIFTTWEKVYHIKPTIEIANSGVDRTTLTLSFGGNQPDIQAMKLLYDKPDDLTINIIGESPIEYGNYPTIICENFQEYRSTTNEKAKTIHDSKGEHSINYQYNNENKGEKTRNYQHKGKSKGESVLNRQNKGKSKGEITPNSQNKGNSKGEITPNSQNKGNSKGEITLNSQNKGNSKGEITPIPKNESKSKGEITPIPKNESKSKGETIISILKSNGKLTLPEIANMLNLSLGGVEKIVRKLKQNGILYREGSTKAGRWIVKD